MTQRTKDFGTGWDGVARFMSHQTWTRSVLPTLDEDPETEIAGAFEALAKTGVHLDRSDVIGLLDADDSPLDAIENLLPSRTTKDHRRRSDALITLSNHLPRTEYDGRSPARALKEAIAEEPDRDPEEVYRDSGIFIAHSTNPADFKSYPSLESFGLTDADADAMLRECLGSGPPPIVRELPRIGRNDPCPCGSEKKWKRCCGRDASRA